MTTASDNPLDPPSSCQRFLDTLKFKPVAMPWLRWGAFLWEETSPLPKIDHSVPPDVSWKNFCEYINYLKHRLGRG